MGQENHLISVEAERKILEDYDVVIAPSFAQANAFNHRQALAYPSGTFGRAATTFSEWVAGLWEMHGDGRKQVDAATRLTLARRVLEQTPLEALRDTPGLAAALATIARQGLGVPAFEQALSDVRQGKHPVYTDGSGALVELSAAETELLACIASYADELQKLRSAELGTMLSYLADHANEVFPEPVHVCIVNDEPLTRLQEVFFERCAGVLVAERELPVAGNERLARVADSVDVRFAFPSGDYALPQVVLAAIDDALADDADARIVVTSEDPLDMYGKLALGLTERSLTCSVRSYLQFPATDFGKLYAALRRAFADEAVWDRSALSDVLHSSFLGLSKRMVWKWDRMLRRDRLMSREEALERMKAEARTASEKENVAESLEAFPENMDALRTLATNPWALRDFSFFAQRYQANRHLARTYAYEQIAAVETFGQACAAVASCAPEAALDERLLMLDDVLSRLSVSVSHANYEAQAGQVARVRFCTQREAAEFEAGSVHTLIACDLTAENYPVSDKLNAAQLLLDCFGARTRQPALTRERRTFSHLLAVANKRVVLERALNDAAAEPTYPSAMLEEFIDAYRDPLTLSDRTDLDNLYQLPESLQLNRYEAGEDDLLKNVRPEAADAQLGMQPMDISSVENLPSDAGEVFVDEAGNPLVRVSPTQIDAYRDCPRSWFVQRRLSASAPDEQAGPAEIGTFMHGLFQRFYLAFPEKVTAGPTGNIARARETMFGADGKGGVFAQWAAEQPNLQPGDRLPLMPGTTESLMLVSLKQRADEWLAFEAEFLPGFSPVAFEYSLPAEPFAGGIINGFVDRIDTDGKGNFVVVDYKGSMLSSYLPLEVQKKEIVGFNPGAHIQALMYAAVLQKQGRLLLPRGTGENAQAHDFEVAQAAGVLGHGALAATYGAHPADDNPDYLELPIKNIVGAVYVSYKSGNHTSGALDGRFLSTFDVPNLVKPDSNVLPPAGDYSYEHLMEYVEEAASDAIAGIAELDVRPWPIDDDACKFCPLVMCGERRCA